MGGAANAANTTNPNTFSTTFVGGAAGISATGSLAITAGRDATFLGSSVSSVGDTTINAGNNLTFSTVTALQTATNSIGGTSQTTQLTGSVNTGGNLAFNAGNDLRLTSTALDVGQNVTLIAGGNLTLDASKNVSSFNFDNGTTSVRQYDETVLGTTLNAGGNITLAAVQG